MLLSKFLTLILLFIFSVSSAQNSFLDTVNYTYNGRVFNLRKAFIDNFKEELNVIKIKDGDTIADIGAGECFLEGALYLQNKNLTLIANDINYLKLNNLDSLLNFLKQYSNIPNNFKSILGNDSSTNIKGITFNKIIIRDALHHFKYPDSILQEIKLLLKPNGSLFISEMLLGETKTLPSCDKIISRDQFFKIVERNGFDLVKESRLPTKNFIVFEFKTE